MGVLRYLNTRPEELRPGLTRRLTYIGNLMTAVLDFTDGPWDEAEELHRHPHVQTSYVASGEIIFYCEGEEPQRLQEGDIFYVPSGQKHGIKLLSKTARLVDNFSPIREDFLQ